MEKHSHIFDRPSLTAKQDIDPYKFSLYRYTTTWEELDIKILKEDNENIPFEVMAPTPAPPVETPPPEPKPETVKAPEEEGKGGICGPTVIVLLAMLVRVLGRSPQPPATRSIEMAPAMGTGLMPMRQGATRF